MQAKLVNYQVKQPVYNYLNRLHRLRCFLEILKIFSKSPQSAKELTESYAAYENLRHVLGDLPIDDNTVYLHVGDGTYPRTATMFAYLLGGGGQHISIDPELNIDWVNENLSNVKGVTCIKSMIEDVNLDILENKNIILVLVHSHVNTQVVMNQIIQKANLIAVYVNPCCDPKTQLLKDVEVQEDWGILSDERQFQVWVKEC